MSPGSPTATRATSDQTAGSTSSNPALRRATPACVPSKRASSRPPNHSSAVGSSDLAISWPASSKPSAGVHSTATVRVCFGIGYTRRTASAMTPSVPSEPWKSFARSYPATFLMTYPPERATVPSASTTVIPMTMSRRVPYACRAGPPSAVAIRPPTVAPSGIRAASRAIR